LTFLTAVLAVSLAWSALSPAIFPVAAQGEDGTGVTTLTGQVAATNPLIFDTFTEPFMLLTDLTAFVERDLTLPLPSPVQVTANLEGNLGEGAAFTMALPIRPQGDVNDVDQGGPGGGVQIYALDFQVNAVGDPFLNSHEMEGWPTALTSLRVETGTNEVIGGRVVVWAPDADQGFPTDFGADGKLFTADDPIAPVPAGWTVVDLEQRPFGLIRDDSVEVAILEGDVALKDLSALSYTAAFDALIAELRLRYPFTDFKRLDWDAIVAELRPLIEQAELDGDLLAFNLALMRLAVLMQDGHVGVAPPYGYLSQQFGGGLGVVLGQTDDGRVVVRCVAADSPAAAAGISAAAEIVGWNGQPVAQALAETEQLFAESTPLGVTLQRLSMLTRMPVGAAAAVAFVNPGEAERTAEVVAVDEPLGGDQPCGLDLADPAEMPVTVEVLDSGIGYLRINTFYDDMTLMTHSWEWALRRLRQLDVPALIIDVRANGGGLGALPLYFAGSFYDEEFELSRQVYVDETGQPLVSYTDRVQPTPVRWQRPVAVLIDSNCASACEIFAAAMAHDPDHLIVGRTPTAGVEAAVFPWLLPGNISFQAPLIALHDADGNVFLEGSGVPPTVQVPNTPETLLLAADNDAVLAAAETALGERIG
jgi:C-terminal processing protease CtpA/Prc